MGKAWFHDPKGQAGIVNGGAQTTLTNALRIQAFADALLDPDIAIPGGIGKSGDTGILPAPRRYSVYRNNVVVSLMEAVRTAYPSLLAIMGPENFDRVARNFIACHPPVSALMQHYGQAFPAFLEGFKPLAKSPFLKDVALAEMYWLKAFHACDADILTGEELQSLDGDAVMKVRFNPHPALHILKSEFPVYDFFEARNIWPKPGLALAQPQAMLITRPVYECMATPLTEPVTEFLELLCNGKSLGEALELTGSGNSDFDATSAIATILQTGAFQSIKQQGVRKTP